MDFALTFRKKVRRPFLRFVGPDVNGEKSMAKATTVPADVVVMGDPETAGFAYQPTPRECAILVVHLIETKERELTLQKAGKAVTRARLSENALRRLWCRKHLTSSFLIEVQEWLFRAGWVLFFAGSSYAIIKNGLVDGWMRISTTRVEDDYKNVSRGQFDFKPFERMLIPKEGDSQNDD